MHVSDALRQRLSTNNFDANASIADEQLFELVRLAQEAPSCFNVQFTRYVAVKSPAARQALMATAYNQPKVGAAAAVFVLTGDLRAHVAFAERTRAAAAAGTLPAAVADHLVKSTASFDNRARAREECLRSVGLSGMSLMLAANEAGLASCPMIGFDPAAVSALLGLDEDHPPLLMIAVGLAASAVQVRKPRLPAEAVLRIHDVG